MSSNLFRRPFSLTSKNLRHTPGASHNNENGYSESTPLLPQTHLIITTSKVGQWYYQMYHAARQIFLHNYIHGLVIFLPLAIVSSLVHWPATVRFTLNFLAIIPLSSLLEFYLEEFCAKQRLILGGILAGVLGNSIELIIGVVAICKDEVRIMQATILGTLLFNLVLVTGLCCVAGGVRYKEQYFALPIISSMSGFAMILVAMLLTPTALATAALSGKDLEHIVEHGRILSSGSAAIFLVTYVFYLVFQLRTHVSLFERSLADEASCDMTTEGRNSVLKPAIAGVLYLVTVGFISWCVVLLFQAIPEVADQSRLSRISIGFILLPFLGGTGGAISMMTVAFRNKQDLALGCIVGNVINITLFVVPVLVIVGRVVGNELSLYFGHVEVVAVLISSLMVVLILQNGRSTYFDGLLLLGLYTMVVMAVVVLPHD